MAEQKYNLESVAFHITHVCTHNCEFCYVGDKSGQEHPDIESLKKIADQLTKDGNLKDVLFVGGDPAQYPYVEELAKYIKQKDPNIFVEIQSNTLEFRNTTLQEVMRYIDSFWVTIHALEPKEHDGVAKAPGAYEKVVSNLKKISDLGGNTGMVVNITKNNALSLFNIAKRIKESANISTVMTQRIIPIGYAKENGYDYKLTREETLQALEGIKRIDEELGLKIDICDAIPFCVPKEYRKYLTSCMWGKTIGSVTPDGEIGLCGANPNETIGNVFESDVAEIWNNHDNDTLKRIRNRSNLGSGCKKCGDVATCGGGCPSISHGETNDYMIDYFR